MKVVLFCGGEGMRMREFSESIPKPMVPIGYRPILWHLMKYYAHFGYKDFILCLGYKADYIKNYFLTYDECLSNDFTLSGGKNIHLYNNDINDWNITFVDTGVTSNLGQRLKRVEQYLDGEDVFMANYSDGLSDVNIPCMLEQFIQNDKIASFVKVKPNFSFHFVNTSDNGNVHSIESAKDSDVWINAGYFIFKKNIFDYIREGDELVIEPFQKLIEEKQLTAYKHEGFWLGMDTFKDKQYMDDLYKSGKVPWQTW
jgi:glucose-1-phosphate cytidylyltransferase